MKAIAKLRPEAGAMALIDIDRPDRRPGEVLVRIAAGGICGTDVKMFKDPLKGGPVIMGHENIGYIAKAGREFTNRKGFKEGDLVFVEHYVSCGKCEWCHSGQYRHCEATDWRYNPNGLRYGYTTCDNPPHLWGGFAQYVYLPWNSVVHHVPKGVSPELAGLVTPMANGIEWALLDCGVGYNSTVLIQGPGQQGLSQTVICKQAGAKIVTKGKSMISEEIDLNQCLEANGMQPVETDLGEYIIQLRNERPSHIIAPAVHLTRDQVEEDFRKAHTHLDPNRDLTEIPALVEEARAVLRQKYLDADVGITGANFLIAETGSSIIVTNEGNGDLTQTLPKVHIVIASIEKVVPTLEDASTILRVLARSATGQDFSNYTTLSTGGRREGDPDGPAEYHVVILDNGRSNVLGTEFQDMLRCIRCGACLNHCPVYNALGGHALARRLARPGAARAFTRACALAMAVAAVWLLLRIWG